LFNIKFLAARAAGMQALMVPLPYISDEMRKKATLVLTSLNEFKPESFGLPPFE
jgi:pseudouridine-5'-monophosphatase